MDRRDVIRERAGKLCDFPGQVIPEATDELLAKADAISKGSVFFYNTQPV